MNNHASATKVFFYPTFGVYSIPSHVISTVAINKDPLKTILSVAVATINICKDRFPFNTAHNL